MERSGLRWAIFQLAAGALGSTLALELGRRLANGSGEAQPAATAAAEAPSDPAAVS
jgi:hypothetical protein